MRVSNQGVARDERSTFNAFQFDTQQAGKSSNERTIPGDDGPSMGGAGVRRYGVLSSRKDVEGALKGEWRIPGKHLRRATSPNPVACWLMASQSHRSKLAHSCGLLVFLSQVAPEVDRDLSLPEENNNAMVCVSRMTRCFLKMPVT